MAAGECLGDKVRLVAGVELIAEILDVPLDRARGNAQLQRALLGGKATSDAFEHFTLAVRQGDEILLLPGKIHH